MGGGRGNMGHQPSYVPNHGDGAYHDGYGRGAEPYGDPYMQHPGSGEPYVFVSLVSLNLTLAPGLLYYQHLEIPSVLPHHHNTVNLEELL